MPIIIRRQHDVALLGGSHHVSHADWGSLYNAYKDASPLEKLLDDEDAIENGLYILTREEKHNLRL